MAKANSAVAAKATKTVKATSKSKAKASKPKAPESYADILQLVSAPVAERKEIAIGRGGEKIVPRRFHIEPEHLEALRNERKAEPKEIPNPHNVGAYWLGIEALKALGANKPHSFKAVKAKMREIGNAAETKDANGKTLWQRFAEKDGASDDAENCLNVDGKIHQNFEVLQRLGGFTPYGLKLLQVGQLVLKSKGLVIDIVKKGDETAYRLNPNSDQPINELRRRRS